MTAMTPALLADPTDAISTADRTDLVERLQTSEKTEYLTSKSAANLLGLSSANTIKNWLKGGHFPGALQTLGGHWRFPLHEVQEAKRAMELLRERNLRRDLALPETEADFAPPLL